MLITTIVLALMAQSPSAAVDTTRAAFTKCLRTDMKKSLEAKTGEAEYEMALKSNIGVLVSEEQPFGIAESFFGEDQGLPQRSDQVVGEQQEINLRDHQQDAAAFAGPHRGQQVQGAFQWREIGGAHGSTRAGKGCKGAYRKGRRR